jgi:hypothetical protein
MYGQQHLIVIHNMHVCMYVHAHVHVWLTMYILQSYIHIESKQEWSTTLHSIDNM